MHKRRLLYLGVLSVLFIYNIDAQQLSGLIYDSETGAPVQYGAVYINGTTIGTISDSLGHFVLGNTDWPDEIVVSHINYRLKLFEPDTGSNYLEIPLERKYFEIGEVSAKEKSRRAANLAYFNKALLGEDYWGEHAEILNDSVLRFYVTYDSALTADGKEPPVSRADTFGVQAFAPLIISLPKLGYILHYDLIAFEERKDTSLGIKIMHTRGRSYYVQQTDASRLQKIQWDRKMKEVYYHSRQHILRSLYDDKLAENGYRIYKVMKDTTGSSYRTVYKEFSFDSCECIVRGDEEGFITGMEGQEFMITYFGLKRKPLDLTVKEWPYDPYYSRFIIAQDLCIIRSDGTIPGGMIVFTSQLGDKRFGATLPSNYVPEGHNAANDQQKPKEPDGGILKAGRL